jgi:amino acid permease
MKNEVGSFAGKRLTVWQAACIITGFGVGGGIMAMPLLTTKVGIVYASLILIAALVFSYIMHIFIADLALRGKGAQISTVVSNTLFSGKSKKPLTLILFVIVGVVLMTSMAAYITGGAEIIAERLNIPLIVSKLIFYIFAASVVIFGLKAVGVSEGIAVAVILVFILILSIASFFNINGTIPVIVAAGFYDIIGYFGMAMFCFTAFFAIPQAVAGLNGDIKKTKNAIRIGFINIIFLMAAVIICSNLASETVTEVAMIGWSKGLGLWAQIIGSGFIILALITTYWSISLALTDMIKEQFEKLPFRLCWLIATLPSIVISVFGNAGFISLMEIAAGASAIILAFLVIPTVRKASFSSPSLIAGKLNILPVHIVIIIVYLLMAVGNLIAV